MVGRSAQRSRAILADQAPIFVIVARDVAGVHLVGKSAMDHGQGSAADAILAFEDRDACEPPLLEKVREVNAGRTGPDNGDAVCLAQTAGAR